MSRPKKIPGFVPNKTQAGGKVAKGKAALEKGKERKKGFQVGPAHAAKNAYLGKAKKIKAELIMKSKLKREYAKVLKESGGQSDRLKKKESTEKPLPEIRGEERSENTERETPKWDKGKRRSFEGKERPHHDKRKPTVKEEKKVRALSPSDVGPPMPQSSLKELKKEAFRKYHPLPKTSSGFGFKGRGQPNMGARMNVLLEKIKRDKA